MAINDTENPEEGTPRSRKDIRRERRQMRSMNAQRAEVGAEPLYTKEEIREVGKPFKAQSSTFMTGTKDGTTYNDPNKPADWKYSYQGSDVINKKGETEEFGPVDITKEQYEAISEGGEAGQALAEKLKLNAPKAQAELELNSGNTNLGNNVAEALKKENSKDPNATFTSQVEKNKQIKEIKEAVDTEEQKINENIVNASNQLQEEEKLPGSGYSAISALRGSENNITWDQTYQPQGIVPESRQEIFARAAATAKNKSPQLVIEKLGIQDYYPEIGRDIAVGTFTGSRIGSQTIYSGAGGLLPLGLYDARKRAIAAEIKRKEALMDELKAVPDIAKQFKPEWTNYVFSKWADYMEAYKNNPDGLSNDLGFAKTNAQLKAIAENFKDVDSYMDDFKEKLMNKDGSAAAWATPGMLQIAKKFNSGFTPEKLEEYFSGKKNIASLKSAVEAIPNGYNHIDKRLTELLKDPNKVKRAIIPKSGIEWTPQVKQKIDEATQQIADGSIDYERYVSIMKEYFDIDFSPMINEWVDANDLGSLSEAERKAYKESLQLYAEAQMPAASFIPTFVTENNNSATRYSADKRLQGQLEFIKMKREQFDTMIRQTPTNLLLDAAILNKKAGGNGSFKSTLPAGKANGLNPNQLKVDVFDANGKPVSLTAQQLKDAKDGTYYMKPGSDPIKGSDIPPVIYYQATEAEAYNTGGNNYSYRNSGVGYKYEQQPVEGGGTITIQEPLKFNFYRPGEQIMQDGYRLGTTIATGDQFLGQPASEQTYKITERGSNAFFQSESEPNE